MTTESIETEPSGSEASGPGYDFVETVRTTIQTLRESANVENVYGEPIVAEGKTIVPVARVAYGFGSGFGSGAEAGEDGDGSGEGGSGGGGGGGMMAGPVGVLEVTEDGTRFVRFADWKRLAVVLDVGIVLGYLLARRRRR